MTRFKRMQSVVQIAEDRERDAAKRFGESQQKLDFQNKRLEELVLYRDEYSARLKNTGSVGISAVQLNGYRAFLSRLNDAISQQHRVVEQARIECERCRQGWLETHTRTQALEKATESLRSDERRRADRQEQKDLDERSLRMTRNTNEK